ncbi:MAG: hypothetical protein Q8Q25_02590 [bacterium]|nr:hypothetical protein [bacterium]
MKNTLLIISIFVNFNLVIWSIKTGTTEKDHNHRKNDLSLNYQKKHDNRTEKHPGITQAYTDFALMQGMYGKYPMTRESSGTSWVPDSSPSEGFHRMYKDWMVMFNGFSHFVIDVQRGKRGDTKLFDANMFMVMAQRSFNKSTFAIRTMFSADPITIGKCGYPLLLQTGETCNGKTPLIDRQHPHDLFDELALVFSYEQAPKTSLFLYAGLPGEPALGPPLYFMRFAGEYIPETPLGHHWMDATHTTFGVLTAGFVHKNLKIETSVFRGREPDQYRFDIEKPKLDSYSVRISLNPTDNLSLQASYGFLKSPEQLHPETNVKRTTLSALYNKNFNNMHTIQVAAILGINDNKPGKTLPAFLIEATGEYYKKHIVFSRFEVLKNNDLFIEPHPQSGKAFIIKKLTLGYVYEFLSTHHLKWGLGGLVDFPMVPSAIKNEYGNTTSFMGFLQIRLI